MYDERGLLQRLAMQYRAGRTRRHLRELIPHQPSANQRQLPAHSSRSLGENRCRKAVRVRPETQAAPLLFAAVLVPRCCVPVPFTNLCIEFQALLTGQPVDWPQQGSTPQTFPALFAASARTAGRTF
jgi:hypothetical protein